MSALAAPAESRADLEQFFTGIRSRLERAEAQQRQRDRTGATQFNVFDLIDPDENKLSEVLALLLDPQGGHGQGNLFLKLLFEQLGIGSEAGLTEAATVRREAPTHGIENYRRRMDVFVDAGVLVGIENKVDSAEQPGQVADYLEHLGACAQRTGKRSVLIYLTPDGRRPDSVIGLPPGEGRDGRLRCWSYQVELLAWLERCGQQCEARKIQDFLADFRAYIQTTLKRECVAAED